MLNCYVVDDELHALNVISDYIARTPNTNLAGRCEDPVTALQEINDMMPDIAFVDIEMPNISGLELSKLVRKEIPSYLQPRTQTLRLMPLIMEAMIFY